MFIKKIIDSSEARDKIKVTLASDGGGEEMFSIYRGLWERLIAKTPLAEGKTLTEREYDALTDAAEKTEAIRMGSRIVASADRSMTEVKRKLRDRGFSREVADYAAEILRRNGLIREEDSCTRIAETTVRSKHYGRRRVEDYLVSRGFSAEAIRSACDSIPAEDWQAALRYNMERKFADFAEMDKAEKQKAVAAMVRLGFSPSEVFAYGR